jgi:hypothetical protein
MKLLHTFECALCVLPYVLGLLDSLTGAQCLASCEWFSACSLSMCTCLFHVDNCVVQHVKFGSHV